MTGSRPSFRGNIRTMPEEPEKSGQEPNLELPSLLGFGRKKKKTRKTDTVADAAATDEVAAEEPAPPARLRG